MTISNSRETPGKELILSLLLRIHERRLILIQRPLPSLVNPPHTVLAREAATALP
jgi:hypothetical protein